MTNRKFHRAVFQLEIISEDPIDPRMSLMDAANLIEQEASGSFSHQMSREINGKQAAEALMTQASEPGFFRLTSDGDDVE